MLIVLAVWLVAGFVDFTPVRSCNKPIFCVGINLADNGGSGRYVGLGYSFDIKGNFMPEDANPGATQYKGYIFGIEATLNHMD